MNIVLTGFMATGKTEISKAISEISKYNLVDTDDMIEMCIRDRYVSDSFFENEKFKYPKDISLYKVQDDVFMKMCDTKAPQGILAVVKIEDETDFTPNTEKSYIYCDCINDPGNLGTIIRTADAAGFDGVLLSDGCVDLYSPKTVRSSMGSFFNMKVVTGVSYEKLSEYKNSGFQLIGGALGDNTIDYRSADMKKPTIIIVGNEANGI